MRRRHPLLREPLRVSPVELALEVNEIDWFDERGLRLSQEDWQNPEGRALMMRRAAAEGQRVLMLVLALNGSETALTYKLPNATRWRVLADSADPERGGDFVEQELVVAEHAAVLLSAYLEEDVA
jgi:glycogen operon protein